MTIENLTSHERDALNSGYKNGWTRDFYSDTDRKTLAKLEARGLMETIRGYTAAITPRGIAAMEYLESKKAEEQQLWDSLLTTVKEIPQKPGLSGTSRDVGEFFHHEDGVIQGRTRLTHYNGDGTQTQYELIATLRDGQITTHMRITVDTQDYRWEPGGEMDRETESDKRARIIVDHVVYYIRPDEPGNRFAGYGGARFDIEYLETGRQIVSRNLWRASTVPPKWREQWPNTAKFLPQPKPKTSLEATLRNLG